MEKVQHDLLSIAQISKVISNIFFETPKLFIYLFKALEGGCNYKIFLLVLCSLQIFWVLQGMKCFSIVESSSEMITKINLYFFSLDIKSAIWSAMIKWRI